MVLLDFKTEGAWIYSRWTLTYKVGWSHIVKAVAAAFDFYDNVEIIRDGINFHCKNKAAVKKIDEGKSLTIRGFSKILDVPVMITLHNQLNSAYVYVARATAEYENATYETFAKSLGQYLDSLEIAMYKD